MAVWLGTRIGHQKERNLLGVREVGMRVTWPAHRSRRWKTYDSVEWIPVLARVVPVALVM